jgi:hypothetical protein
LFFCNHEISINISGYRIAAPLLLMQTILMSFFRRPIFVFLLALSLRLLDLFGELTLLSSIVISALSRLSLRAHKDGNTIPPGHPAKSAAQSCRRGATPAHCLCCSVRTIVACPW